jgi:endoglucanase
MVSYNAGGVVAPAQQVNGLAAGQSVTLSFPAATGSGMTITATADSTGVIAESNETNNSLTVGPFPVPNQAATCTPTSGTPLTPTRTPTLVTNTPTRTPTVTVIIPDPTPLNVGCSPVTSVITAPFTWDGAGVYCWQSSNLGTYINNWNNVSVTINNVDITNIYVPASSYPAKVNGFWYVSYNSNVAWGHFEAK